MEKIQKTHTIVYLAGAPWELLTIHPPDKKRTWAYLVSYFELCHEQPKAGFQLLRREFKQNKEKKNG